MNKKAVIFISILLYLVSAYFAYSFFDSGASKIIKSPLSRYSAPKNGALPSQEPDEPKTEQCPLNGEMLTKTQKEKWEKRRPLGIMIENHQEARPQSGLMSADIVYEAVAEGGITRFLAIYYCKDAQYVGPVRSARVYFIDALSEYGEYPLYAHVGGANTEGPADALGKIRKLGWNLYNDLNQFAVPFPYYWRDYERLPGRITEHTVYSTTTKLWDFARTKRKLTEVDEDGVKWDDKFVSWKFEEEEETKGTTANTISFDFWDNKPDYSVSWKYDQTTGGYKRTNGGAPHIDKNNNKQIEAQNLVILFAQESPANDGYSGGHLLYKLIGKGDVTVFKNGVSIKGTWEKEDAVERMKMYDSAGKDIVFTGGLIFIEIVPKGNTIEVL